MWFRGWANMLLLLFWDRSLLRACTVWDWWSLPGMSEQRKGQSGKPTYCITDQSCPPGWGQKKRRKKQRVCECVLKYVLLILNLQILNFIFHKASINNLTGQILLIINTSVYFHDVEHSVPTATAMSNISRIWVICSLRPDTQCRRGCAGVSSWCRFPDIHKVGQKRLT